MSKKKYQLAQKFQNVYVISGTLSQPTLW